MLLKKKKHETDTAFLIICSEYCMLIIIKYKLNITIAEIILVYNKSYTGI